MKMRREKRDEEKRDWGKRGEEKKEIEENRKRLMTSNSIW